AGFARNVLAEHNSVSSELIIHEVMGRHCGWLTAAAARKYRDWVTHAEWLPEIGLKQDAWDIHAVFVPEVEIDLEAEALRLEATMNSVGNVNIFLSEGAGVETIVREMEERGETVPRDAFGHVQLDKINPGAWFAEQFASMIGAKKVLVQKSGYYSRSAAANAYDLALIKSMTELGVDCALNGISGVIGHDEQDNDILKAIAFDRIAGAKPFDFRQPWYLDLLEDIGQPAALG
ncbi:MAG: pyrophosphate--fructose-6-phosphate 1-phosphotransferase, partial [Propionibacteriaceae bacterium]|nr:pyrophosphate--fructose-6-phosphate 1-phosphotransferase [Propionibacteriaceae bacterium]